MILRFLYKSFALLLLFAGGYLLLRFAMDVNQRTSFLISCIILPAGTCFLWFSGYRGKKFK